MSMQELPSLSVHIYALCHSMNAKQKLWASILHGVTVIIRLQVCVKNSGVARPGPTRACALPSTSQALPSPGQQDSRDSSIQRKQTYMVSLTVLTQSSARSSMVPYSGLCLRGPNFCEFCQWLIDSQIFLLKWSGSYNLVRHVNYEVF